MKKFAFICLAALGLTFASCSKTPEQKAVSYCNEMLEAMQDGDMGKAMEVAMEAEKWQNSLPEEEQKAVKEASKKWEEEHAEEIEEAQKNLKMKF